MWKNRFLMCESLQRVHSLKPLWKPFLPIVQWCLFLLSMKIKGHFQLLLLKGFVCEHKNKHLQVPLLSINVNISTILTFDMTSSVSVNYVCRSLLIMIQQSESCYQAILMKNIFQFNYFSKSIYGLSGKANYMIIVCIC